jgi:hypothetical protein
LPDFIAATLTSMSALFFLSLGIAGYFGGPLSIIERAIMIGAAGVMALFPIGLSIQGILPLVIGLFIPVRIVWFPRRSVH